MARRAWRDLWRRWWGGSPEPVRPAPAPASGTPRSADRVGSGEIPASRLASAGIARLRVGVVSTVGNYREHNEDNFYLPVSSGSTPLPSGPDLDNRADRADLSSRDAAPSLFVVADGMGGQLAGEKASQMAVEIVPKELSRRLAPGGVDDRSVRKAIRESVAAANHEILGLSVVQSEFNHMGTTVVLALFREDRVYIAGIGDSRAYRARDGRIERLTKDHSLAQALADAGTITPEELPNHKFNHILYNYLGSKEARGGPDDVHADDVRAGDRFLLASDGLTGVVPDERLAQILAEHDDPQAAARALMQLALDCHSKDNVTCLVIHAV